MPFVEANGIQIYYEEHGAGFPVLLIQGLGYPSGMWFRQIPAFSRPFRTIVFDNRGVGRSDKPDEVYTVALMAQDACALLERLGIERAHVVGASLGGYIAQELTLRRPDLVERLVLMVTSCGGPRYLDLTKPLWDEVATLAGLPPEEIIRRGMALATTREFFEASPEIIDRSVAIRLENLQPLFAFTRQFSAGMTFNSAGRTHRIEKPTLILAGARDRVMPLVLTEELAHKVPRSRLMVYPDGAHLLFLEKVPEVNDVILRFLSTRE
jgi:pimeloyl-ACP methyl ester carboxylesterase